MKNKKNREWACGLSFWAQRKIEKGEENE